jgi:biotin transport system substrate-specific component
LYTKEKTFDTPNLLVRDLILAMLFAALTAVSAQIAVRLPFSPVPITFQVLMVIGTGLALGSRRGLASQFAYLAAGAMGLPVFAGGTGGPAVLFGPTAGYLLAFPAAAFVAGWLRERSSPASRLCWLRASLVALAVIYAGGASWLAVWLGAANALPPQEALTRAWHLGVAPFVLADIAKAVLAITIVRGSRGPLSQWFGTSDLDHSKGSE